MEGRAYEQFRDGVGLGSAAAFWPGEAEQFADRALLVTGHGNVGYAYNDEGVVMIDTGTPQIFGDHAVKELRRFSEAPIRMVIYTHGHIDHAFNLGPVLADAQERGFPRPQVIAHRRVPARFARYQRLREHTSLINRINFGTPADTVIVPDFFYPDTLIDGSLSTRMGRAIAYSGFCAPDGREPARKHRFVPQCALSLPWGDLCGERLAFYLE